MPYTPRAVQTVSVDVQQNTTTDPGVWGDWEVVASAPFAASDYTEAGTGDVTLGATTDIYEGRKYEIEFYPESGYATPTASPITADATAQEFLGDYLSSSGTRLAVTIVNAPQTTTWKLEGPGGYENNGVGDMPPANVTVGDYTITWGWQQHAATPVPYPWQETKTVVVDSITTFDTPYVPRSAPEQAAIPLGTGIRPDVYWMNALHCSNILSGSRDFKTGGGAGPTSIDGNGWPTAVPSMLESIAAVHGNGKFGLQTFWMYWKGHGTVQVRGEQNSGIRTNTELLAANGEEGVSFQLYVKPEDPVDPENFVERQPAYAWFQIHSTDGADHLRDVEIVHEDCIVIPVQKDFRNVGPAGTYLDADFHATFEQSGLLRLMDHIDDCRYFEQTTESLTGGYHSARQDVDYESDGRVMDTPALKSWATVRHARQMQIDIINASGKDYWCCFPPFDNDTHLQAMIDQIEAPYTGEAGGGLHPDRVVYIEWGNENWNSSYAGHDYARYWGMWHGGNWVDQFGRPFPGRTQGVRATPTPGFEDITYTNPTSCERRYTSYRTWKNKIAYETNTRFAAKVSAGEYSGLSDRVKVVCPGFASWIENEHIRFSEDVWPSNNQPAISFDGGSTTFASHVDMYAPQLYTSPDSGALGGGGHGDRAPWPPAPADYESRAEEYFDHWLQWQIDNEWPSLEERAELATKWGLDLVAYEAGQHVTATSVDGDFLYYVLNHPRMYEIYTTLYDKWYSIGAKMPVHFTGTQRWKPTDGSDFWGIKQSYYAPTYQWYAHCDWTFNNPLAPGGPGPTPDPTELITVVVDSPSGASWSISPDPGGGNGSGSTNKAFQALLDDYTITWNDTAISSSVNTPDSSNGPITLTVGNPITWTASDFYTILATGTVNVDIQKDAGAESGTEGWDISGDGTFDETDFYETGVGDATPATGPFYHGRDYVVKYASEGSGFTTPADSSITADSGSPQTATGNYVTVGSPPVGVPHDIYWIGHSLLQQNITDAAVWIAQDLGFQTSRGESIIPGAPLKWHWCPNEPDNPTCPASNSPSRLALATGNWDTVVMTEGSPLPATATSVEYGGDFVNLQRQLVNGDIFVWETWENRTGVTTWPDPAWRANLLSEASEWQAVTDGINDAQGGTDVRRIRGGNLFWVEFYDELLADNITGFDKLHEFFKPNDTIHMNDYGAYFNGLIIAAELFQTPVTGATNQIKSRWGVDWPAGSTLSTTVAAEMQAIVDGITGYT